MDDSIKKKIIIKTQTHEQEMIMLSSLHEQLVGNQDYIDSNIILNDSSSRNDGTKNEVHLIIFNNSKTNPVLQF